MYIQGRCLSFSVLTFQGWTKTAEWIQCQAPLPKNPAIPLLTKMLVPAPYQAPEKKAKETRSGLRRKGISDMTSEDAKTHSSAAEEEKEAEERNSPLRGEGRKGRPPRIWRQRRPRRGRFPLRTTPRGTSTTAPSGAPGISPWPNRKYSKTHSYIQLLYFMVLTC